MRELKVQLASGAVHRDHRDRHVQAVEKTRDDKHHKHKKKSLYTEKRAMIISATATSVVAGCLLIVLMFWLVAAQS